MQTFFLENTSTCSSCTIEWESSLILLLFYRFFFTEYFRYKFYFLKIGCCTGSNSAAQRSKRRNVEEKIQKNDVYLLKKICIFITVILRSLNNNFDKDVRNPIKSIFPIFLSYLF